jgi:hypothetical protein
MSAELVSIIIPCYNAEQYVGEAIQSALDQTYPHAEVIVIDDGSTDRSLDVIKSFGDAVRWESGPNRGGCAARNRGIELAEGELIQFLDADDLLHPAKLARQVELAITNDASLVFCDGEVCDAESMEQIEKYSRPLDGAIDPVVFMLGGGLPVLAPLHWKRNLQTAGGFREELPCSQERDLHLRLACHGMRFRHLPATLYTVRRVTGSVSSDSTKVLDQHSNVAWNAFKLLRESGELTEERRAAFAGFLASDARAYLCHGMPERSREYFLQASRMHPDGGIPQAYSGKTRLLYRLLGPLMTQRLVGWKRRVFVGQ